MPGYRIADNRDQRILSGRHSFVKHSPRADRGIQPEGIQDSRSRMTSGRECKASL